MLNYINTKTQRVSAAVMAGAMLGTFGEIGEVFAGGENLNQYLSQGSQKVNEVPNLVAFVSYLGGTALAALGIVNLKQHVENPGNKPMKDGLAKLGFGGMLLALPTITSVMMETGAGSSGPQDMQQMPTVSF